MNGRGRHSESSYPATSTSRSRSRISNNRSFQRIALDAVKMTRRNVLRTCDECLLRVEQLATASDKPPGHEKVRDMSATMGTALGAELAARQIGVNLPLVISGFSKNDPGPAVPSVALKV